MTNIISYLDREILDNLICIFLPYTNFVDKTVGFYTSHFAVFAADIKHTLMSPLLSNILNT